LEFEKCQQEMAALGGGEQSAEEIASELRKLNVAEQKQAEAEDQQQEKQKQEAGSSQAEPSTKPASTDSAATQ